VSCAFKASRDHDNNCVYEQNASFSLPTNKKHKKPPQEPAKAEIPEETGREGKANSIKGRTPKLTDSYGQVRALNWRVNWVITHNG
jgi:hypothetical protein